MTALWTAHDIARATGGTSAGDWSCAGICIDSRAVAAGDLFIALVGPNHDAHGYVAQALASGAAGALVHTVPDGVDPARLIVVTDTFRALESLGRAGRDRFTGKVIGVTGSVGKTSTKEMLAVALAPQGTTLAAVGSFNNHWGVPLTLARMPADAAFAVIEMGMNHAGELSALTAMARPDVAIITTIAAAHIEYFGSLDAIADAKAEIFEGVTADGTAILPRDSAQFRRLRTAAQNHDLQLVSFGSEQGANLRLIDAAVTAETTRVRALIDDQEIDYTIGSGGLHWAFNSLAVLAAVRAVGGSVKAAAFALSAMTPPKGRGQRHTVTLPAGGSFVVVDESYNANPDSVRAALAALAAGASEADTKSMPGRRIAVLGDMLELGPAGPDMHAALAAQAVAAGVDRVFTAGPLMAHLDAILPQPMRGGHAADSATLAPVVAAAVCPGDVVMVKGSAGSRMGGVVAALLALNSRQDA